MKLDRYELKAEKSLMVFEFISNGPNGLTPKIIKFSETNLKNVYNLAFGDNNPNKDNIDDLSVSNNGDSEKVLSTVVATVYAFTNLYPHALVYATGSTKSRTRLYRRGITKYSNEILKDFHLYGLRSNEWEVFEKEIEYEAFLVTRKKQ